MFKSEGRDAAAKTWFHHLRAGCRCSTRQFTAKVRDAPRRAMTLRGRACASWPQANCGDARLSESIEPEHQAAFAIAQIAAHRRRVSSIVLSAATPYVCAVCAERSLARGDCHAGRAQCVPWQSRRHRIGRLGPRKAQLTPPRDRRRPPPLAATSKAQPRESSCALCFYFLLWQILAVSQLGTPRLSD